MSCRITRSDDLTYLWEHHPRAEGLFWRLLAATDDFGRMEYDPRMLRSDLVPKTTKPQKFFEEALAVLVERGMAYVYEARGRQYLQVTNYDLYQEDQAWTRIKAECPPPPDWTPPAGLVAFLNEAKDKVRFYPGRYGLESNGDGGYRTVTNGNESGPQHSTAQHPSQHKTQLKAAPPPADAPPAQPREETDQQKAIRAAWEAHGLGPLPKNPKGYSGLTGLLAQHGCPRAHEWGAHVRLHLESPPEGAAPWPWFCARFRAAMNRPWEWDGSRGNGGGGKQLAGGRIPASKPEDFHGGRVDEW
jgi:hypothetical protein